MVGATGRDREYRRFGNNLCITVDTADFVKGNLLENMWVHFYPVFRSNSDSCRYGDGIVADPLLLRAP